MWRHVDLPAGPQCFNERPPGAGQKLQLVRRRPSDARPGRGARLREPGVGERVRGARKVRRSRKPAVPGGGALVRCSLRLLAGLSSALLLRDESAGAARAVPVAPRVRARVGGGRPRLGDAAGGPARRPGPSRHCHRGQFLCKVAARPRILLRYGSGQRHPRRRQCGNQPVHQAGLDAA